MKHLRGKNKNVEIILGEENREAQQIAEERKEPPGKMARLCKDLLPTTLTWATVVILLNLLWAIGPLLGSWANMDESVI